MACWRVSEEHGIVFRRYFICGAAVPDSIIFFIGETPFVPFVFVQIAAVREMIPNATYFDIRLQGQCTEIGEYACAEIFTDMFEAGAVGSLYSTANPM